MKPPSTKRTLLAPAMQSALDTGSDLYLQNREEMAELLDTPPSLSPLPGS